jgi:hypothetical protein
MKYKVLSLLALSTIYSYGVELRVGQGTFDIDMGISNLMQTEMELDTTVFSIANSHDNFSSSPFYYTYDIDLYTSDFQTADTTVVSQPSYQSLQYNTSTLTSSSTSVVDTSTLSSEYKITGVDLNFGLGYDLHNNGKSYFGISVMTGLTVPLIEVGSSEDESGESDGSSDDAYNLLDETEFAILTYKLTAGIHAGTQLTPNLLLQGSAAYGMQTGSIDNDWFGASFDVDGTYSSVNLALKYTALQGHQSFLGIHFDNELYFVAGYTYKSWDVDTVELGQEDAGTLSSFGLFDLSFETNYLYAGIGYNF